MNGGVARMLGLILLAAIGVTPPAAGAVGAEAISPEHLARLQASPDHPPIVIDLRPEADFMAGTVAGALHGEPDPVAFAPSGDVRDMVLIPPADENPATIAVWIARLGELGLRVLLLEGGPQDWRDAGVAMQLPGPVYTDPGAVPFVIPRGICEHLPPVQEY